MDPDALWRQYVQLTEVEAAFRALKSELAIRPIWHRIQRRVEAHILVAFLGYCLWGLPQAEAQSGGRIYYPGSRPGEPLLHPDGRGLVQTSRWWPTLPAPHH
jgi:hypothetical protein